MQMLFRINGRAYICRRVTRNFNMNRERYTLKEAEDKLIGVKKAQFQDLKIIPVM